MDERDAARAKVQVHRRDMAFVRGYVSCANCACNYDCTAAIEGRTERTFCQIYSRQVDPLDEEKCINTAEACDQWVGASMDRNMVVTPSHSYRYDKWGD